MLLAIAVMLLSHVCLANTLHVFAAASLRNALDEIIATYGQQTPTADIRATYAGSSTLARQISLGAPADLFISANTDWMDHLIESQHIEPASRRILASNELILISDQPGEPLDLTDSNTIRHHLSQSRVAVALVDAVPAGIYAKAALTELGHWHALENNLIQTDNVRAALRLVEMGEVPWGIVYKSDIAHASQVSERGRFPKWSHPTITYPSGLTQRHRNESTQQLLQRFQTFLHSTEAQAILKDHGFGTPLK